MNSGRDQYESEWSLAIEENARQWMERRFPSYKFLKLSARNWTVDWMMVQRKTERVRCFLEFRRRFNRFGAYDDFQVSAAKLQKLKSLAGYCGTPSAFILQTNDKLASLSIGKNHDFPNELICFGRTKPRDGMDYDPAYKIQWGEFKVLLPECVSDDLTVKPTGNVGIQLIERIRRFRPD